MQLPKFHCIPTFAIMTMLEIIFSLQNFLNPALVSVTAQCSFRTVSKGLTPVGFTG